MRAYHEMGTIGRIGVIVGVWWILAIHQAGAAEVTVTGTETPAKTTVEGTNIGELAGQVLTDHGPPEDMSTQGLIKWGIGLLAALAMAYFGIKKAKNKKGEAK